MTSYGVIGGLIGGMIALTFGAGLNKYLVNRHRKKLKQSPKHKSPAVFRPWIIALFVFLSGIGGVAMGIVFFFMFFQGERFAAFETIMVIFFFLCCILVSCWSGSLLCAKITISEERMVLEHAIKMSKEDGPIGMYNLGRHHLDVRWDDIRELRGDINFLKIILRNGETYVFPLGWCKTKAAALVTHHKKITPWK